MNPISSTSRYSPPPPARLAPNNLQREGRLNLRDINYTDLENNSWAKQDFAGFKSLLEYSIGLEKTEALLAHAKSTPSVIVNLFDSSQKYISISGKTGSQALEQIYEGSIQQLSEKIDAILNTLNIVLPNA